MGGEGGEKIILEVQMAPPVGLAVGCLSTSGLGVRTVTRVGDRSVTVKGVKFQAGRVGRVKRAIRLELLLLKVPRRPAFYLGRPRGTDLR